MIRSKYNIIYSIIIVLYFGAVYTSYSQSGEKQDSIPPVMLVKPLEIVVEHPESRFIEREIKVFNRGGGSLKILAVNASCSCSSGKTLQSDIHPLESGRIILSVNMDGLKDNQSEFEFKIESNAKNSPVTVLIKIKDATKRDTINPENK